MFIHSEEIENYAQAHTTAEEALMRELREETISKMEFPQMLTGPIEGRFLGILARISGAKLALEIGTFTGYSALSIASGLPAGGRLITCEIDENSAAMARRYFERSSCEKKIELRMGPALETIAKLELEIDFTFIDADKGNYPAYYEAALAKTRPGGLIVVDNTLWSGRVLDPQDDDTRAIAALNAKIAADPRVENVLLTVRDGIQVARKL